MPITPLTIEARAVERRMRAFPAIEGNAQCLQQLVYQDSATCQALIPVLAAITPPVAEPITQGLYMAAARCGTALECGGNIGMWPLMIEGATFLDAALDVIEAAQQEEPAAPEPQGA